MLASGILATWSYVDLGFTENKSRFKDLLFKPLMEKSTIKKQLESLAGYVMDAEELKNVKLVEGQSLIGDLLNPIRKLI